MTEPSESQVQLRRIMDNFTRMEENLRDMELHLQAMQEHAAFIEQVLRDRIAAERKAKDGEV